MIIWFQIISSNNYSTFYLNYLMFISLFFELFDDYFLLVELPNRGIFPCSGVWWLFEIICNYWDFLITNNHRIKYILFDDYLIANNQQIIPIIQSKKKKCEYPVHILQIIRHIIFDNYLTYLMIIWWLFDDYLTYLMIIWKTWTRTQFRFRRAMLPQNPGGQTCMISEYCSSVVRGRGCNGGDSGRGWSKGCEETGMESCWRASVRACATHPRTLVCAHARTLARTVYVFVCVYVWVCVCVYEREEPSWSWYNGEAPNWCCTWDPLLHIKHTNCRVLGRLAAHSTHSTAICQPPHPSDSSGLRPNLQQIKAQSNGEIFCFNILNVTGSGWNHSPWPECVTSTVAMLRLSLHRRTPRRVNKVIHRERNVISFWPECAVCYVESIWRAGHDFWCSVCNENKGILDRKRNFVTDPFFFESPSAAAGLPVFCLDGSSKAGFTHQSRMPQARCEILFLL